MIGPTTVLPVAGALAAVLLSGGCASVGNVFRVSVGDCFDDPQDDASEIAELPLTDCDDPHDNEVYAVLKLPDGDFPGAAQVMRSAQDGCLDAFESAVGQSYERSALFATWILPTRASWQDGDRDVVCVLFADRPLQGSMVGTGR